MNERQMTIGATKLLVATKNAGKIKELNDLLTDLPLNLLSLSEFPSVCEVEETGRTFAENAALKARSYALQTSLQTVADDSGLEVNALGGKPGIFSARYAGESATDEERTAKLLQELSSTRDSERRARFVCAMAISDENGEIKFLAEGVCNGKISLTASGTNGFGYDPIFIPDGYEQTFGELPDQIKQEISHRGRAARKIIQYLRDFYAA